MRLIDADKLKSAFETCDICKECPSTSARCAYECTEPDFLTPGIRRVIDAQPTVDAVPVIRCRDCKFRYWDDWIEEYCCRRYVEFYASYDGFCSSAEQREGEEEE
nr:hypothetical protein [uncultured Ruminococcus sp.]